MNICIKRKRQYDPYPQLGKQMDRDIQEQNSVKITFRVISVPMLTKKNSGTNEKTSIVHCMKMSRFMRLWHLSPSVNSIFKHACAAIHCGYASNFWSDPSSTLCMRTAKTLARLREPSLFAYAISTIISRAGSMINLPGPSTHPVLLNVS